MLHTKKANNAERQLLWTVSVTLNKETNQKTVHFCVWKEMESSERRNWDNAITFAKLFELVVFRHWRRQQLWDTAWDICPLDFKQCLFCSSLRSHTKSITANSIWFFILHSFENVRNWQQQAFVFGGAPPRTPLDAGVLNTLPLIPQAAREGVCNSMFYPIDTFHRFSLGASVRARSHQILATPLRHCMNSEVPRLFNYGPTLVLLSG